MENPPVVGEALLKSLIVSCYAHWEGFYNDCANAFLDAASSSGRAAREISPRLLVGVFSKNFARLRDMNHSRKAQRDFVDQLNLNEGFSTFDKSCVLARSNLNFEALSYNYTLIGMDVGHIQPFRLKLDKEIVGYRHELAHGGEIDMAEVDMASHVAVVDGIMRIVAGDFQAKIISIDA